MKRFEMTHHVFGNVEHFTEADPPHWLALDNAWFWRDHVLTLKVGGHTDTDFRRIVRIE